MKPFKYSTLLLAVSLFAVVTLFSSCDKDDEFTIENKQVTGTMDYIRTAFVPLTFDTSGLIPLSARISMDGTGTVADLGTLTMTTTFDFDFTTGMGTNFVATYTESNGADTFTAGGTSQAQLDGTFHVDEIIISGTGKFSKITGGGLTIVQLNAMQTAGTGDVMWTVTF